MKIILVIVGFISLSVGILGVFLPLLPTTVFLLISAACFARSSTRLYNWLLDHRWFGPYIKNWREHRALTRRTKKTILVVLWGSLCLSAVLLEANVWICSFLLLTGTGVTLFILYMKTLSAELYSTSIKND